MKRLSALMGIWALVLSSIVALAQLTSTGAGKKAAGTAAYSGPGDIVASATAWYGLRAYSAADRGNRLLNVCNVADVACADLSSDATTGALVISAIGGSSCSVVTCTIKTMYDRAGSADATQTTIANRPALTVNCVNGLPCATFLGSSSQIISSTLSSAVSQPHTYSGVAIKTTSGTGGLCGTGAGSGSQLYMSATNLWRIYAGSIGPSRTANDSVWHAAQGVMNGASGALNLDGSDTTGTSGANPTQTSYAIGAWVGPSNYLTGSITECGLWPSGFSSGNRTAMCQNQQAFYNPSNFGATC